MEDYKDYLEKTKKSKERYDELTELVMKPEIIADNKGWKKLVKERSSLEDIANAYTSLLSLAQNLENCENDPVAIADCFVSKVSVYYKYM